MNEPETERPETEHHATELAPASASTDAPADEQAPEVESRRDRLRRHSRHAQLYLSSLLFIALLVVLVGLISANTGKVRVSWVFGDTNVSVAWLVLLTAVVAWLLGIVTSTIFRHRTRRRN